MYIKVVICYIELKRLCPSKVRHVYLASRQVGPKF